MRRATQLSMAICLAALNACGGGSDSTTTGTDNGLYSDYVLTSVNGQVRYPNSLTSRRRPTRSSMVRIFVSAPTERFRTRATQPCPTRLGDHASNVTRTGTFVVSGSTVTLNYQDAFGNNTGGVPATLNGRVMTKVESANTFTFAR